MQYKKQTMVSGAWAKGSELGEAKTAIIVTETVPQSSSYQNKDGSMKMQDVCKVKFDSGEAVNLSLNRATINGLVDAFGEDSKLWVNKRLNVETEKMRVAGKAVVAIYLIPEGYRRIDDANGYAMIVREGAIDGIDQSVQDDYADEIPASEIPF